MGQPTRTLLILLALALGGISALAFMAQRYARVVDARGGPSVERELARVDGFIAVRSAMQREVRSWGRGGPRAEALKLARDRGLLLHGVNREDYAEVREHYRAWREGRQQAGSALVAALERRRSQLRSVDLGPYESLDS